jgi:hypothetical protein
MLPGAAVAVFRSARVRGVPLFVGAYLAVWTLVGVAACTVYRPHEGSPTDVKGRTDD